MEGETNCVWREMIFCLPMAVDEILLSSWAAHPTPASLICDFDINMCERERERAGNIAINMDCIHIQLSTFGFLIYTET